MLVDKNYRPPKTKKEAEELSKRIAAKTKTKRVKKEKPVSDKSFDRFLKQIGEKKE